MAEGVKIGYARTSSSGPPLDEQLKALKDSGVAAWNIFVDEVTGSTADRPKLREAREFVTRDDTLVTLSLDRVASSFRDLLTLFEELESAGVALVVLDQAIDTGNKEAPALLDALSEFARFDSDVRKERQMDGIRLARARGVKVGRKPSVDRDAVIAAYGVHHTIGETARATGTSKPTVHRILRAAGIDTSGKTPQE